MSIEEVRFAIDIGKPVVAVKITESTSRQITALNIPIIAKEKILRKRGLGIMYFKIEN